MIIVQNPNKNLRASIQLVGNLRTFDKTYESLFKNVIEPLKEDGYEVDIFVVIWSEFEHNSPTWHNENGSLKGKKVLSSDIERIKEFYNPISITIEKEFDGGKFSHLLDLANKIHENYEMKNSFEYDVKIYTRPDIYFHTLIRIKSYLEIFKTHEELRSNLTFTDNCIYSASSLFNRFDVIDTRYITEVDLFWFATKRCDIANLEFKAHKILINYILNRDFFFYRADVPVPLDLMIHTNMKKKITHSIYKFLNLKIAQLTIMPIIQLLPYFISRKIIERTRKYADSTINKKHKN